MADALDVSRRDLLKGIGALAVTTAATPLAATAQQAGALPGAAAAPPTAAAPKDAVRFGITAHQTADIAQILALWQAADALGFDSAFVFDHFMAATPGPPAQERFHEAWTLLAGLAAQTRRIRVGLLVNSCTYRHPAIVAKMGATIDQMSNGRLILGLGAGWLEREHVAYGIPFYTKGVRARRLGESVEVITQLWTQPRTTYTGTYFQLKDAPLEPKPVQKPHPPILIGGSGPKVVQPIAAKYAQFWHFGLPTRDPAGLKQFTAAFDDLCRRVGRNPAEVVKATSFPFPDTAQGMKDLHAALPPVIAAGIRYFIMLPPPDNNVELLQKFAREFVAPDRG